MIGKEYRVAVTELSERMAAPENPDPGRSPDQRMRWLREVLDLGRRGPDAPAARPGPGLPDPDPPTVARPEGRS